MKAVIVKEEPKQVKEGGWPRLYRFIKCTRRAIMIELKDGSGIIVNNDGGIEGQAPSGLAENWPDAYERITTPVTIRFEP